MPGLRSLPRAALLAAAIVSGIAGPVVAGQRTGTLTVTVQVVDSCSASTTSVGLSGQACASAAAPVAVLREAGRYAASTKPKAGQPVARTQDDDGIVTEIY